MSDLWLPFSVRMLVSLWAKFLLHCLRILTKKKLNVSKAIQFWLQYEKSFAHSFWISCKYPNLKESTARFGLTWSAKLIHFHCIFAHHWCISNCYYLLSAPCDRLNPDWISKALFVFSFCSVYKKCISSLRIKFENVITIRSLASM